MNIEIGNASVVEYEITKNKNGGNITVATDYIELSNKPKINNIELLGNKALEELGIQPKGNYLTEHQDLSKYATKEETNNAINGVSKDISNLQTASSVLAGEINNVKTSLDDKASVEYVENSIGTINTILATLTEVSE